MEELAGLLSLAWPAMSRNLINVVADRAVNATLDAGRPFTRANEGALRSSILSGSNLRLCVDGGLRGDDPAAMGGRAHRRIGAKAMNDDIAHQVAFGIVFTTAQFVFHIQVP